MLAWSSNKFWIRRQFLTLVKVRSLQDGLKTSSECRNFLTTYCVQKWIDRSQKDILKTWKKLCSAGLGTLNVPHCVNECVNHCLNLRRKSRRVMDKNQFQLMSFRFANQSDFRLEESDHLLMLRYFCCFGQFLQNPKTKT